MLELLGRLPGHYVIFTAEVYSLLQASGHVNGSRAVVYSDSVNCLSGLDHDEKVRCPWMFEVQGYTNITFVWVPGWTLKHPRSQAMRLPTF